MRVVSGRSLKYLAGFGGSLRGKFGDFSRHHGLADVTDWGAQAASLPLSAASRNASRDAQSSNIEIGSRQAAANYRPAACAPRKIISPRGSRRFLRSANRRAAVDTVALD